MIFERNNLIKILGGFKQTRVAISKKQMDILVNEYFSKIALIDKQMSRIAAGFSCSVCHELLTISDEILACEWCGSPAHRDHLLKSVKSNGYCPACGEFLKHFVRNSMKTVTHDFFKEIVYSTPKKVHRLKILYSGKPIEPTPSAETPLCPECKRPISPDWKFCRYCGNRLKQPEAAGPEMTVCPRCGRQIKSTWKFCKLCGHPLASLEH